MKADEILTLLKAGYSKEEIDAMTGKEAPKDKPKAEPETEDSSSALLAALVAALQPKEAPKEDPKPEAKPEPKQDPKQDPKQEPKQDALILQLVQTLRAQNANIDIPPKRDIDTVLADHFSELMIGKPINKKEE